jgi:acyl-CoA reductase-like NAD-dependent aldehyde dehydrogenase
VSHLRDRLLRKGDYIYGSFLKPERVDGWINAVNPGDRTDLLGRFAFSAASVDDALGHAALGAARWRRTTLEERAGAVSAFRRALQEHAEVLAALLTRENGKPLWDSRQEIAGTLSALDVLVEESPAALASRRVPDTGARSEPCPRGVVGVVSPYALPVHHGATMVAAALLGGNAVVYKPSKFSPGTGQALAELWDRCRLPRGTFNLVQGSGSVVGTALVRHAGLDALVFAGSYDGALEIRRATVDRPELPMVLQAGGKGLAIVLPGAPMDKAVYEVLTGAFLTAGQRPDNTARVLVPDAIFDAFTEQLVARARRLVVGYGARPDVFMGPLISETFRSRHRRYCRAVAAKGHATLLEGQDLAVDGRRGNYASPAIYAVDPDSEAPFLNDEPPGPVLLCYRVRDVDAAIAVHEQARFRRVTSVFARPDDPALPRLSEELHTGALHLNRGTVRGGFRLPSVGLGRAANGGAAGIDLIRTLTSARSVLPDPRPFDPRRIHPGVHWGDDVEDTAPGEAPDPGID